MHDTAVLAVFASGSGTNLQALLDTFGSTGAPDPSARVGLVISDRPEIAALARAEQSGVPTSVIAPAEYESRTAFGEALLAELDHHGVELVALAGYLRLVPENVVDAYRGRILNIHPAPLPGFGGEGMYGQRVHRAVLESGARVSGPTVHFVDERYDTGAIIAQWPVPVVPGDTAESLAGRVLQYEHRLYPAAVRAVARGAVTLGDDGRVRFHDEPVSGNLGFALSPEPDALKNVSRLWAAD